MNPDARPPHRWWCIGPKRSNSKAKIDRCLGDYALAGLGLRCMPYTLYCGLANYGLGLRSSRCTPILWGLQLGMLFAQLLVEALSVSSANVLKAVTHGVKRWVLFEPSTPKRIDPRLERSSVNIPRLSLMSFSSSMSACRPRAKTFCKKAGSVPRCLHHFVSAADYQQGAKPLKPVVTVVACLEVLAGGCCRGLGHKGGPRSSLP